ncbi:MAG: helix-turn-helix domain-containing protein [Chloroflexi bacterium]|nr:helix-turn-helix domain-containing protein [Chloroflexota bacterium]
MEMTVTGAKVTSAGRRPRIALLAAPETSASVLYGLYDVLLSVGAVYPDMTVGTPGEALLDVFIVAATAEPFRCFGNILVEPAVAVDDADDVDVAIVCDMYTPITEAPTGKFAVETAWLRRVHSRGGVIATVCTGSVLLAESGLLDGRSCASHWAYGSLFQEAYPRVRFRPEKVLELAHEADGLITGGGVTAWQDLALYLIARYCGPAHAAETTKVYLIDRHAEGQLPYSAMTRVVRGDDAAIARAVGWIDEHYAVANPVSEMAGEVGLQPRTFARRFVAATGRRPIEHVHAVRMETARRLLEAGATAVDDVGYQVGYEDPTFFRRLFRRATGLTPAAYRRKYAAGSAPQ